MCRDFSRAPRFCGRLFISMLKKHIAVDHTVMYYVTARTIIIFIVCISINNERMPGLIVIYAFVLC